MAHEGLPHARCALGAVMHEHKGIRHGNAAGRVRVRDAMLPAHSNFRAARQEAWVAGCPCCRAHGGVGNISRPIMTPPLIMPFITPVQALHI